MNLLQPLTFPARLQFALFALLVCTNALAIDAPANPRGTVTGASQIKWEWDWAPGAKEFEIVVDGSQVFKTPNPYYVHNNLWQGEHSMRVRAIDWNNQFSASSATIKINLGAQSTVQQSTETQRATQVNQSTNTAGLSAPTNVSGTETESQTATWTWSAVPSATKYEVTVDGSAVDITSELQYTSRNLWKGEHSLSVKALNDANQISAQSETFKLIITGNASQASTAQSATTQTNSGTNEDNGSVQTPANPRGSEIEPSVVKWEWDWTPGATQYEVTVDGAQVGTTTDTHYYSRNLWTGDHSFRVKAINGQWQYSAPSDTVKLYVTNNTSQAAAPPPTPVAQNDTGLIDPISWTIPEATNKPNYELVFSDEFNGGSINPNRWHTQLRWDGEWNGERYEYRVINGESQFYVNTLSPDQGHKDTVVPKHNPFELDGQRLAIRAIRNPLKQGPTTSSHGSLYEMVSQQDFLSGAIASYDKFKQKYGYFEARIKIPGQTGTFPAFWLHHQNRVYEGTHKSEIDIMENLGHAPHYVYNSFHYFNNVTTSYGGDPNLIKPYPEGQIFTGTDYSQDYHVYAVEWEPNKITWFIDGQQVSELNNGNVNYEELYIILNLALGGNWTNYPTSSGGLGRPSNERWPTQNDINQFNNPALEIDYVRAYKRR